MRQLCAEEEVVKQKPLKIYLGAKTYSSDRKSISRQH